LRQRYYPHPKGLVKKRGLDGCPVSIFNGFFAGSDGICRRFDEFLHYWGIAMEDDERAIQREMTELRHKIEAFRWVTTGTSTVGKTEMVSCDLSCLWNVRRKNVIVLCSNKKGASSYEHHLGDF
jgi:hypothetical protein